MQSWVTVNDCQYWKNIIGQVKMRKITTHSLWSDSSSFGHEHEHEMNATIRLKENEKPWNDVELKLRRPASRQAVKRPVNRIRIASERVVKQQWAYKLKSDLALKLQCSHRFMQQHSANKVVRQRPSIFTTVHPTTIHPSIHVHASEPSEAVQWKTQCNKTSKLKLKSKSKSMSTKRKTKACQWLIRIKCAAATSCLRLPSCLSARYDWRRDCGKTKKQEHKISSCC